jgi:hypothetical protein
MVGRANAEAGHYYQRSPIQDPEIEYLNYEPREDLCAAACSLGKHLKMPVYVFLKESIIRKYGEVFYETLEATAKELKKKK